MDVGFASAEVAPLHGVVKQAVDAVAVVLVVLGGVDAPLRGDAVGAAGRIVKREDLDVVTELGERGGRGRTGEAGADDDDVVLFAVAGADEFEVDIVATTVPLLGDGTGGDAAIGDGTFGPGEAFAGGLRRWRPTSSALSCLARGEARGGEW